MKDHKITKTIAISLLLTVFNVFDLAAAGAQDAAVVRVGAGRTFYYTELYNAPTKEIGFAIKKGAEEIHSFVKNQLSMLHYNAREDDSPFETKIRAFAVEKRQAVEQAVDGALQANAALRLDADLNRESVLQLFDGILREIFDMYQPFLARIDHLHRRILDNPFGKELDDGITVLFPEGIGTATIIGGKEVTQCDVLQELANLQSAIALAIAHVPWVLKIGIYPILLAVTNADQIRIDERLYVRSPLSVLYTAYGNPASTSAERCTLELAVANTLNITTPITICGRRRFSLEGSTVRVTFEEPEIPVTKEMIVARAAMLLSLAPIAVPAIPAAAVPAPAAPNPPVVAAPVLAVAAAAAPNPVAPRYVYMFTEADDKRLQAITEADVRIQDRLRTTGRTPLGWGAGEVIMDYGEPASPNITPQMHEYVYALIRAQFERRGIQLQPINNHGEEVRSADSLKEWFRAFPCNTDDTNRSLDYVLERKSARSIPNAKLFEALRTLQALHSKYKEWPKADEKDRFLAALHPVVTQSIAHLEEHRGKCETGAKGRTFLINISMVRFLKDAHPNLGFVAD